MGDIKMRHKIKLGEKEIEFELARKDVKNINLTIKPDFSIFVSASEEVPLEVILDFIEGKASWILKHINYFKEARPAPMSKKEYVSGESFRYLGRQYRLKVKKSKDEGVKYFRGYIYLYTKDVDDYKKKEKLYDNWLRERANIVFHESLDKMHKLVKKYNIPKPELKIRRMKARWGSCYRKRSMVVLNLELIKAPKYCIDYVVLHELIHFIYRYHDNDFYGFLTTLMPDWQDRKKVLDEEVGRGM